MPWNSKRPNILMRVLGLGAAMLTAAGSAMADGKAAGETPRENPWASMASEDIAAMRQATLDKGIYPNIGDPLFAQQFAQANADAQKALPTVKSRAGYSAVVKRYLGTLQDPHTSVTLNLAPATYRWPSFLMRPIGARYEVMASKIPGVADGAEISACDGKPVVEWLDAMAPIEGVVSGLEATRATMARIFLVDSGNPFYSRPAQCVIAGKTVDLTWSDINAEALAVAKAGGAAFRDPTVFSRPFGAKGVWVRMGVFQADAAQAAQYQALYAQSASFRDKDVIVLDVRGNGGGNYNWFMGFLRALYGEDYTAYYARARLQIRYVYMPASPSPQASSPAPPRVPGPLDAVMDMARATKQTLTFPNGRVFDEFLRPNRQEPTGPAPANPVRARVLVLTDWGCASACISFVDEMRRFPGVLQIGRETYIDKWSGSPTQLELPSGNGRFTVPTMIRLDRARGDNQPWKPDVTFNGDLGDTTAVEAWINAVVLKTSDQR